MSNQPNPSGVGAAGASNGSFPPPIPPVPQPSAAPTPAPAAAPPTRSGTGRRARTAAVVASSPDTDYPSTQSLPSSAELEREAERTSRSNASPRADVERAGELLGRVSDIFSQRVVGQEQLRLALVSSLIAGGHILLESVPGLAKTTAAQTLAAAVSGTFHRIQCTPDLMPNDIVGTQVLNYATGEMTTQLGPVHANIVLLDEINRSSAKTQSAMLEAMQERQTSIGGVIYPLPQPFMVMATQNPIEEEGTYVLPEAQMDRFLMKEVLTYPKPAEEADVLDRISNGAFEEPIRNRPISTEDVEWLAGAVERVYVDPVIKQYIVALVNTSRGGGPRPVPGLERHVRVGASPRGGIALMKIAQAVALQAGRTYVTPDDVRLLRYGVLRHRLVLTYDALADDIAPESIIDAIFAAVPTP
ncbi:AAA family ATPase [Actinomyces glycerinitolerans]|uniref:Atpase aaa-3 n=1 Tax=Actinomyces glycerinitolerans TaxID=1892869 RepID=A0A1M4RX56_9ACTO|nr:MoxR family ATPase [Actinomyces glycerinitolerans]SHE24546.1 atpase aaa-3 [Actinomyces glycerinitolerans]